jgi:radical SAM-linked protein
VESRSEPARAVQRLRLTFSKEGPARYIGHLDLARALERTLNRAGLPAAYSQGFNRRPRLSLAAPLPLGYTSEAELADLWLTEVVAPESAAERLRAALPPGLGLRALQEVPLDAPSLQQCLAESTYVISFLDRVDVSALRAEVGRLLGAEKLERARKKDKKPQLYDLRPLILDLTVEDGSDDGPTLRTRLQQAPGRFGRPDELLMEMGFDPFDARVHRVAIGLGTGQSLDERATHTEEDDGVSG